MWSRFRGSLRNDYKKGKPEVKYSQVHRDGRIVPKKIIFSEYIRHQIDNHENNENHGFTNDQLYQSINDMRLFLQKEND